MTKVEYIRASHREANRKIRVWLDGVYRRLNDRSRVLDCLWRVAAWVIFGMVWAVGWLAFVASLFRDVRYTTHFMESEIGDRPPEEARQYLLDKQQEHIRRLSYGSVSAKEQKRIDNVFEYLLAKYPAPAQPAEEPLPDMAAERHAQVMDSVAEVKSAVENVAIGTDRMIREDAEHHKQVIGEISEVKTKIDSVATGTDRMIREDAEHHKQVIGEIAEVKTTVKTVAAYTDRKTKEDTEREKREAEQLAAAERRQERHRSKTGFEAHPVDFSPKMSDTQIALLTKYINDIRIFRRDVTAEEMTRLFLCEHKQPLQTTHNKMIALLLETLSDEELITPKWQRVAAHYECFTSKQGKPLTAKDLSSAKQMAELMSDKKYEKIIAAVNAVVKSR